MIDEPFLLGARYAGCAWWRMSRRGTMTMGRFLLGLAVGGGLAFYLSSTATAEWYLMAPGDTEEVAHAGEQYHPASYEDCMDLISQVNARVECRPIPQWRHRVNKARLWVSDAPTR